jgi:para-nitrobenzyl esterase
MHGTPIARTALGALAGVNTEGVAQFRAVPFAMPPVGAARFAAPLPAPGWSGTRDAGRHAPVAPQFAARLRGTMGDFTRPQDEDCLTLTITTPAADGAKRPVFVWLHGGGYMSGAGSLDWYDGGTLAREGDVVTVGVNYRLGALGFLKLPGAADGAPGLLDMIAALRWVREHIAAFGGDPERVTVAGQSGGAFAIMCMLAMGGAERLFHRAILQSPPAGMLPLSSAASAANARHLAELLGIAESADEARLCRLRAAPVPDILEAQHKLLRATARFADLAPPFLPVLDGFATHGAFLAAVAAGAGAAGVDIIIGTTRDEANAFFCDPTIQLPPPKPELVAERFAALSGDARAIDAYRRRHPGASVPELVSALVTDHTFLFPAIRLAEAATRAGARIWLYQFDWAPPATPLKACHCIELPFVFGNLPAWTGAPMMAGTDLEAFAALSAGMQRAWTGFVHGRDPAPGMPWPSYEPARRQTFCFGTVIGPVGDPAGVAWRGGVAA